MQHATFVIDEQTINYLRQINLEFSKAIKEGNYYSALKLDEQFHRGIIEITDNPYISNTLSTLQAHVRRLLFHNSIILTHDSVEEHEAILQAFEGQDSATANSIARNNWLRPIDEYYSRLKENGK